MGAEKALRLNLFLGWPETNLFTILHILTRSYLTCPLRDHMSDSPNEKGRRPLIPARKVRKPTAVIPSKQSPSSKQRGDSILQFWNDCKRCQVAFEQQQA